MSTLERRITTKRKILIIAIATIAFLLSLGITLYPVISSSYHEKHQSQIQVSYQERLEQADTAAVDTARKQAIQYNQAMLEGVREDAFDHEVLLCASEGYKDQLNIAGNGIMGYVEIPNIRVSLPIYHGTADVTLQKGVGHLLGSSLPVGGESTHAVLTGHSGMASQRMFSDLDLMKTGDVFYLDVLGERMAYQVDQIKTVLPYDTTHLGIVSGMDHCTLITCTPFGVNTHRLLVRGIRIPYEQAQVIVEEILAEEMPESTWEQEYKNSICITTAVVVMVGLAVLAVWLYRRSRHAGVA